MLAFFSEPKPAYGLPDLAAPAASTMYFDFWERQAREVARSSSFSPKAKILRISVAERLSFPSCWLLQKMPGSFLVRPPYCSLCLSGWANCEEQVDTSPHFLLCTESRMVIFQTERGLAHPLFAKHGFGYVGWEKCSVKTEELVYAPATDHRGVRKKASLSYSPRCALQLGL